MKTSRSLPAFLLALVALPIFALAQEPKPKPTGAPDTARSEIIPAFKFENTTLVEIVSSLRKLTGANIILAPSLRDTKTPDIELLNVTPGGVMQAIAAAMPDITVAPTLDESGAICWSVVPRSGADKPRSEARIIRIFKASAKEKPVGPKLDELIKNISDAARTFSQMNAKAEGRPEAQAPVIEAHGGTGLLAVHGTETQVQLVGQVIQALGGEVVPFTGTVPPISTTRTLNVSSQVEPGDTFVKAYLMVQAAEKAEQTGDRSQAISKFESAAAMLAQIATNWPNWQTKIVTYRKMKTTEALSRLRGGAANPSTSMPPPTPIPNTAESRVTSPQDLVTKLEEVHKQFEKSHALLEKLPEHREKSREMLEKSRALLENAREQAAVAAAKKDEVALAERKELLTLEKVLPMPGLKPETREILQKRADELKKRLEAAEPPKAK